MHLNTHTVHDLNHYTRVSSMLHVHSVNYAAQLV